MSEQQQEKPKWNRVVPVEYEPLTRKVEVRVSTIAFGVFIGNVLTGIVGSIFYAIVSAS